MICPIHSISPIGSHCVPMGLMPYVESFFCGKVLQSRYFKFSIRHLDILSNGPSGPRRFCGVRAFCRRQNLGGGMALPSRAFQSPEGRDRLRRSRRRDGSAIPSISITGGPRPPSAVGAQTERTSFRMSFRFGGGGESRTPVRKPFHGNFSGRRRLLRESCSPCSRHPGQAVTPRGLVSFMIHGRRKALPAHVHH